MGRAYAGILGPIAFVTVVARAVIGGGNAQNALLSAMVALFAFAVIGYVVGMVAERVVVEGVEARIRHQWQATQTGESAGSKPEANANSRPS